MGSLTPPSPTSAPTGEAVLQVDDLTIEFPTHEGPVRAVDGVSFEVRAGETVGIVGESGSGKSVTVSSILGLLPSSARVTGGRVHFDGQDLLRLDASRLRRIRGRDIAMVFQDPMTSLNPVRRVGLQLREAIRAHDASVSKHEARDMAIGLLADVGIPHPERRIDHYPHEYSGGMRQRVMIAMAMANRPKVLIADEPTTALDVTIQAQILDVLRHAQATANAATILITHDLGVVAELADRVVVMYGGRVVESGDVRQIFHDPRHPYTRGLLGSMPTRHERRKAVLSTIPGSPPSRPSQTPGCVFHPRCGRYDDRPSCRTEPPVLAATDLPGNHSACHYWAELADEDLSPTAQGARS